MTDPGYTKANITYEANAVLKYLSKKSKKPAYAILDDMLVEKMGFQAPRGTTGY